jgi:hypothetical protein
MGRLIKIAGGILAAGGLAAVIAFGAASYTAHAERAAEEKHESKIANLEQIALVYDDTAKKSKESEQAEIFAGCMEDTMNILNFKASYLLSEKAYANFLTVVSSYTESRIHDTSNLEAFTEYLSLYNTYFKGIENRTKPFKAIESLKDLSDSEMESFRKDSRKMAGWLISRNSAYLKFLAGADAVIDGDTSFLKKLKSYAGSSHDKESDLMRQMAGNLLSGRESLKRRIAHYKAITEQNSVMLKNYAG